MFRPQNPLGTAQGLNCVLAVGCPGIWGSTETQWWLREPGAGGSGQCAAQTHPSPELGTGQLQQHTCIKSPCWDVGHIGQCLICVRSASSISAILREFCAAYCSLSVMRSSNLKGELVQLSTLALPRGNRRGIPAEWGIVCASLVDLCLVSLARCAPALPAA